MSNKRPQSSVIGAAGEYLVLSHLLRLGFIAGKTPDFTKDYDLVVAMYHDQGHCPVKVMGINNGINITAGIPIIRTSVDHGTGEDIAGKGIASDESLLRAINLAYKMSINQ